MNIARSRGVQGISSEYPRRFRVSPHFTQMLMRQMEMKNRPAEIWSILLKPPSDHGHQFRCSLLRGKTPACNLGELGRQVTTREPWVAPGGLESPSPYHARCTPAKHSAQNDISTRKQ